MGELREAAQSIGLAAVSTYIQSGNLIFDSSEEACHLATELRAVINDRFGLDVPVVVRTTDALATIGRSHPFETDEDDERFLVVAFLDQLPPVDVAAALPADEFAPDRYAVSGSEIYIHHAAGSARSKLNTDVIDRGLGVTSTMRNWRTIRKLVELSGV